MLIHRRGIASVLICLALGACSYRAGGSWGSGMSSINASADGKTVHYSIARLEREKRPYLVLAIDQSGGAKVGGGGGSTQGRF
jgi:hypothetical protein